MILTGPKIRQAVKFGEITIEPFDEKNLNPNSYNYRLGKALIALNPKREKQRKIDLTPAGCVVKPGMIYLATTLEKIGSNKFVTLLLGRSSIGRLGLFLNITADLGHCGSCSHWTLELSAVQPVRVYPGMKIGQVSFWLTEPNSHAPYTGRYHRDSEPTPNRDPHLANTF